MKCYQTHPRIVLKAGAKQPIHLLLEGKGLGIQQGHECIGWFAQILYLKSLSSLSAIACLK